MIYQSFAQLYDQLFDETLYKNWRDYTLDCCPAGAQDVLDLAGGAGRLGVLLAQAGLTVTVADFSPEMLTIASQHAEEAGVALNLVEADMRDLQSFPRYDLVTCYADSLCYLPNLADIKTTLGEVKKHLKSGGRFLFDVITPYQTDQVYPGYMYNYEDDDHERAFLWQSFADDDVEHGVIHDLTFFNRLPDGNYQRVGETHFERSYPQSLLIGAVKQAGFNRVTVTANFGRQTPNETTTRWFFECQK
ncbi:class I SAM-dependent methyltransferase [Limosilactobacillus panis]|uniref:class I SAM-dependent DNA methyltransferase n=1 Tax=Limosilactobacillus panis TaxID=47493 RepID=UPI001C95181B|nr:class I SAM-dependent methyltransferase [Limosilactobacillus panis]QZN92500.1 class I SAM-dependent methyltransferase [Limosilactobacillus panis]